MKKLVINQHEDNHPVISSSEGTVTGVRQSAGVYILTTSFSVEGNTFLVQGFRQMQTFQVVT